MKKNIILFALLTGTLAIAQVGINTEAPEATLDIRGKNHLGAVTAKDGLLVPRVNNISTNGSSDGQLVFLIAKSGTFEKGFYSWDVDSSTWKYLGEITAKDTSKDAWENDVTNSTVHLPTLTNGTSRAIAKDVFISDNGNIGIGVLPSTLKMDVRENPTSTTNPGIGSVAIGETTETATALGAGAIRYSTNSGGRILYSNGSQWNAIASPVQKIYVEANKTSTQTINDQSATYITNWSSTSDNSNGGFDASSGIFTAPRKGNYSVTFSYAFEEFNVSISSYRLESQLDITEGGVQKTKKTAVGFPSGGKTIFGSSIGFVISLNAGDTVRPRIYQYTNGSRSLITTAGYNNFSVAEL